MVQGDGSNGRMYRDRGPQSPAWDQEEEVSNDFLKELPSEQSLRGCIRIFLEKWGREVESGFTLRKWGEAWELR